MENGVRAHALSRRCSEADLKRSCHIGKLQDLDTLMFKSPSVDMTPKRKRKRHKVDEPDEDSLSIQSMDVSSVDTKKRRRSSLAKMTSLSNLLSPINKPVKKMGQSLSKSISLRQVLTPIRKLRHREILGHLSHQAQTPKPHVPTPMRALRPSGSKSQIPPQQQQAPPPPPPKLHKRTLSLKNLLSPSPGRKKDSIKTYQGPAPTPPKRRLSTFWYETVEDDIKQKCSTSEMERQEAIFELYQNEEDLIEDLNMVKTTYHDSLCKLKLMTESELKQIFGSLYDLIPLHQDLVEQLRDQRLHDGTTEFVGEVLLNWIPRLQVYVPYCANQVYSRALLDHKKKDPAIDDFLERCQESPFSRHLDLWSFLDIPRSRLVKYPLLLRNIQKKTDEMHTDHALLDRCVEEVEKIIKEVDEKTGEAKCRYTYENLEFIDDKQKHPLIKEAKVILCDGILKNNRGTKLHVFLFERIIVLTRPATRGQKLRYQVYRQPIPVTNLILDDLEDGESKRGSFRSTFTQNSQGKNQFRVTYDSDSAKAHSYTLQANDEHDKRQWVAALHSVLAQERQRLGINATRVEGRDCVDPQRVPMTRSASRCSLRLGPRRRTSTSSLASLASMSSIGSFSSLYSLTSYDSSALDTDDSCSLMSQSSSANVALSSSPPGHTSASPAPSVLDAAQTSTPTVSNVSSSAGTKGTPAESGDGNACSPKRRRRSTLTPPGGATGRTKSLRSSFSPDSLYNTSGASPNQTVFHTTECLSPAESEV